MLWPQSDGPFRYGISTREGVRAAAAAITARHGVVAFGLATDLRDPQAVIPAALARREALGRVGAIVHAAGTAVQTGIEGVTPENWDAGLALHVRAIVLMTQAFREDLKGNPGSAIVAISSINAMFGNGSIPIYSAAKGAVLSLVRSTAASFIRSDRERWPKRSGRSAPSLGISAWRYERIRFPRRSDGRVTINSASERAQPCAPQHVDCPVNRDRRAGA